MMENEPKLAQVFHFDLQGKRDFKYDFLNENTLSSIHWNELQPVAPNFFLVKKDFDESGMYEQGFKMDELFPVNSVGIVTSKDEILINESQKMLLKNVESHYKIEANKTLIKKISYRVFDERFIYYDVKIMDRARDKVMKHLFQPNLSLIIPKQAIKGFKHTFISKTICDKNLIDSAGQFGAGNVFPLYFYSEEQKAQLSFGENAGRTPNLNPEIIKQIADGLGLIFSPLTPEGGIYRTAKTPPSGAGGLLPIDVLDYIYAVLHSPTYREKYKEFLKIDFPRVPYPKDVSTFWQLVKLGGEIRQIHLLESEIVEEYITQYPESGSDVVGKIKYEDERVYINENQYFDNVPQTAWNFYIGGYQPAQKWLKDRKERVLSFEDILHYQKIIVALTETARLMKEIDLVVVE